MKKIAAFTAFLVLAGLHCACERHDWKETRMFHDVPGKSAAHAPESGKADAEAPKAATQEHGK